MAKQTSTPSRLAPSGGWVAACESLLAEADRLSNEYATAAATTPSFLLDDGEKVKIWRASYYREAAGWLLMQRPNGRTERSQEAR